MPQWPPDNHAEGKIMLTPNGELTATHKQRPLESVIGRGARASLGAAAGAQGGAASGAYLRSERRGLTYDWRYRCRGTRPNYGGGGGPPGVLGPA